MSEGVKLKKDFLSIKGNPQSPVKNDEVNSSETLPVTQEIEAFSLKEDGDMNVSKLQSYYADMPELQFHQMMQDVDFFAQEFSDPVFEFQNTFSNLVEDYIVDPEPEVHARTSIQSAENLIEPEWLYNIREGESYFLGDSGQITNEDYDSEASYSEYYSCEEENGSNQALGKFNDVEHVLNLLHEVAQSPAVQFFADFVPECVVPFYTSNPVEGTVIFDEGVSVHEDQNVGNSKLCKETSPSFDNEESQQIDLSSSLHVESHDKLIPESGLEDCAFWSILTDTVSYYQEENVSSFKIESELETTTTYHTDSKVLYFCADHNNEPHNSANREPEREDPQIYDLSQLFQLNQIVNTDTNLRVKINTSWQLIVMNQN